jgi:outer membrane protein assembly factor BamB
VGLAIVVETTEETTMNSLILMRTRRSAGRAGPLVTLVAAVTLACLPGPSASAGGQFNAPGNILITDQFNNRVIEIDPAGTIVWSFGSGHGNTSAGAIVGTNDAERVGVYTLMSGTGIPAGATKNCKKSGCSDNRVILVDPSGNIVWQYGQFNVTGFGANQLNTPVQNTFLPNGHILITDQGNQRIIEVRPTDNAIVWQYGQNGVVGSGANQLSNPNAAELLANGHILISDENNNRAIEVTHTTPSQIVATFTAQGTVSGVAFASRLLITDSNNARIVEVDSADRPVWQYFTNTRAGSNPTPLPTRAVRLVNGNTLISDQFNNQVIEVNASMEIVASYGKINDPGFSPTSAVQMNAPYSAYVIGDYTGITPPQ